MALAADTHTKKKKPVLYYLPYSPKMCRTQGVNITLGCWMKNENQIPVEVLPWRDFLAERIINQTGLHETG